MASAARAVDSLRFVICHRLACGQVFFVCRGCDRGQLYCRRSCGEANRREKQRAPGQRYQRSWSGRLNHAARAQRYRARRKNVTHHRLENLPTRVVEMVPLTNTGEEDHDDIAVGGHRAAPVRDPDAGHDRPGRDHPEGPADARGRNTRARLRRCWRRSASGKERRSELRCVRTSRPPLFDTGSWTDALLLGGGAPLYDVAFVPRRRRRRRYGLGLGDMRALEQLVLLGVAR
jgi:hypothetical protein